MIQKVKNTKERRRTKIKFEKINGYKEHYSKKERKKRAKQR